MNTQPTSPPCKFAGVSLDANNSEQLQRIRGLAEAVRRNEGIDYAAAQSTLITLDAIQHGYSVAAKRGYELIVAGRASPVSVHSTSLCEHYAGKSRNAYQLLADHYQPWFEYQMSCCAASLRLPPLALRHLAETFTRDPKSAQRAVVDVDFRALWEHFASGAATREECHLLCRANFDPLRVLAEDPSSIIALHLDDFDYREMPEQLRATVRRKALDMTFDPASRNDGEQVAFERWWKERIETAARLFREADSYAQRTVLAAQPGYAEAAAERGDMMAARWHCELVLKRDARCIVELLEKARHPDLRRLLEGYHAVHKAAPDFLAEFEKAVKDRSSERALSLLESLPESILANPFVQHRYTRIARVLRDPAATLRGILVTLRAWPNDAMPYYNAIIELAKVGNWEGARRILEDVPPSFWRVKRTANLAQRLEERDPSIFAAYSLPEFRGEPDLAGEIEPPSMISRSHDDQ